MRRISLILLSTLAAGGCQTYRSEPLDRQVIFQAWQQRSADSETVRQFADHRLADNRHSDGGSVTPAYNPADGVELAEGEVIALFFNPELRRARLEANVARVGAAEAGRWEDPSLQIDAERVVSGAKDPWVVGGLLNLTIPVSGRLSIERKLARGEADVAELRVLVMERQVVADLRKAWVEWSAATARVSVIQRAIEELTVIESAATKLRDAGEIDPADARWFTIDLTRQRGQLRVAERDLGRLESRLGQLMGLSAQARFTLIAQPALARFQPSSPASSQVAGDAGSHPRLALALAAYEVAERSLELEVRKQFPDIELGGGFGTDQGDSRLLGGVSIPLPLLNANRRGIAEARARRDVARAEFEVQLIQIVTSRDLASRQTLAAQQEIEAIERDLIPLVDQQLIEARRLLQLGEFNPILVREAISSAADAKLDLVAARLSLAHAMIDEQTLTETPFHAAHPKTTLEAP